MSARFVTPKFCVGIMQFLFDVLISVYLLCLLGISSQYKRMTYTNCCIYTVVPPDDEQ
jgi:hypothetical protein